MKNRFAHLYSLLLLVLGSYFFSVNEVNAQCGADITFTDTRNNDTVTVGANCMVVLNVMHVPANSGYSYPPGNSGGNGEKGKYSLIGFDSGTKDSLIVKPSGNLCFILEFKIVSILDVTTNLPLANGDAIPAGHTIKITYSARNSAGITRDYALYRVIVDKTPPTFTVLPPASLTASCQLPAASNVAATDNCSSGSNLTINFVDSGTWSVCAGGTVIRTWTATDSTGNTATVSQTITMSADDTAPVITGFPSSLTERCDTANYTNWLANQRLAFTATDNCAGLKITDNAPATFTTTCGSVTVTFTATDTCGKAVSSSVTYTTIDNIKPTILTQAKDTIRICDTGDPLVDLTNWLNSNGGATASDNCGTVTWSYTPTNPNVGGCSGNQGSIVSFVAKDVCGNTDTTKARFTIWDINPPNITVGAQNKIVSCNGLGNSNDLHDWLNARGGSMASDVCTSNAGLSLTMQVNGQTVDSAGVRAALNASINSGCQDNVSIGGINYNNVVGRVRVMFAYTDLCGNVSTTDAYFAIVDTLSPLWVTTPSGLTIECDTVNNVNQAFLNWYNSRGGGVAADICSGVSYNSTPDLTTALANLAASQATSCGNTGQVTVDFFALDGCGNSTLSQSATFKIVDNISPKISPTSSDLILVCNNTPGTNNSALQSWIANNGGASATDNCGNVTWTGYNWLDSKGNSGTEANPPVAPNNDCQWFVDVTFIVKDECANQSTSKSRARLTDLIAPVLSDNPADITVECNVVPTVPTITATDNCDTKVDVIYAQIRIDGSCTDTYTLLRTWTATDDCGNSTVHTQTIKVQDTQRPILIGVPADVTVSCDNVPNAALPTALDNCDNGVSINFSQSLTKGTDPNACIFYTYEITRTWTATDNCGNNTSSSQVVTVQDLQAPTFALPANVTVECTASLDPTNTGIPTNIFDNCGSPTTVTHSDQKVSGSCENSYQIQRTWTVSDICGNTSTGVQVISVRDSQVPSITNQAADLTIDCTTDAAAEAAFAQWVLQYGGATFVDNCGIGTVFAAVPGTYNPATIDLNNPATFPQNSGGLNAPACPSPIPGVYRFEKVDFVIVDKCNNVSVTSAIFYVNDNTPPVFLSCPPNTTVNNDAGVCQANVTLLPPSITDGCANGTNVYTDSITRAVPVFPNSEEIPVSAINYMFNVPAPPISANSSATLTIVLDNIDAEEPTEFFEIIAEDGSTLGQTANTPTQCGQSTTTITLTAAQINAWATDGLIKFNLKPNIPSNLPGRYSINPICPNGSIKAKLTYGTTSTTGISYSYSIDGGAFTNVNPIGSVNTVLSVGVHTITYRATDCAGNSSTCSNTVTVLDKEAPTLICPSNITDVTPSDKCEKELALGFPTILDNCGLPQYVQTQPTNTTDALMTYTYNPNLLEYIADNKSFSFTNVAGNAYGSSVSLTLRIKGDIESAGEYFTILAEDNSVLGTTEVGQSNVTTGNCTTESVVTFSVPTSSFNTWANDGIVTFRAISNIAFPVPPSIPGRGINPCNATVTSNGANDGSSYISATLRYSPISIEYFTTGATVTPTTAFPSPSFIANVAFKTGTSTVSYIVPDAAGNKDTCSYNVTIVDNQPPVAKCNTNTFVFVNASGINDTLKGSQIDAGSTDNCKIVSYSVTPNLFNCNQAGTISTVILTVTDAAGQNSSCTSLIKIDVAVPKPTYEISPCGGDALRLYANPPGSGASFKYKWFFNNNLVSTDQNPVLTGNLIQSGSYVLEIEGFTGCKSTGNVLVNANVQSKTPVITATNLPACSNKSLDLSTQSYFGPNIRYKWYQGLPPGTLIGTTSGSSISIPNPTPGTFDYYVVVESDSCTSNPSIPVKVTISLSPTATTLKDTIKVCEGVDVSIGTSVSGSGFTYNWTGPNGFSSTSQNPAAFKASTLNAGTYTLIITSGSGCSSKPATTELVVSPRPDKPIIVSNGLVCTTDSIVLTTNVLGGDEYHWVRPNFTEIVTATSKLVIYNAQISDAGKWGVYIIRNGCRSETSDPVDVPVINKPSATFSINPNPACSNSDIQLTASNYSGVSYIWTGPTGAPAIAPIYNPVVPPISGTYSLTVITSSGCANFFSQNIIVKAAPEVVSIVDNAQKCVSGAQDIKLTPTVSPAGNYTYEWRNPQGGFISNDSILTIPNATFADRGSYTLFITEKNGCKSTPKTHVLDISEKPFTPTLALVGNAVCEGGLLQLDVKTTYPQGLNITYKFITPQGVQVKNVPSYIVTSANASQIGEYKVVVDIDGCLSDTSNIVPVTITPIPAKPIISTNSPVCEGDSLKLCTTQVPTAVYEWTGPNFNSSLTCPTIYPTGLDKSGIYKLRVIVNGCASPYSDDAVVVVRTAPAAPLATANPTSVCISNPGATLTLSVTPPGIAGARYIWYDAKTDTVIAGPTSALNVSLSNLTAYGNGLHDFYVRSVVGGCQSLPTIISVTFNTIPTEKAFAGDDVHVCDGKTSAVLSAQAPTIGSGFWTQISGKALTIVNSNSPVTPVNGIEAGQSYTFRWTLSNGACGAYSFDEVNLVVDTKAQAQADSVNVCNTTTANLNAKPAPSGSIGTWSQLPGQAATVTIVDVNDPKSKVTGLQPGNVYYFKWTLSNKGCGDYSSVDVIVNVSQLPPNKANAGVDISTCADGTIELKAEQPSIGTGFWTSLDPSVQITNPNLAMTSVSGLRDGDYKFVWSISNSACGTYSTDTLNVRYFYIGKANDDGIYTVKFDSTSVLKVTLNDNLPNNWKIRIKENASHGQLTYNGNGEFTYLPGLFVGIDRFVYEVCRDECPDKCSSAVVTLAVGDAADCEVPTVITPNGDNINDEFFVPCLESGKYPNNSVVIFNQWGDEVFRAAPYDVNSRWRGVFDGQDLPASTYFYIVTFGNGEKPKSGFIMLER